MQEEKKSKKELIVNIGIALSIGGILVSGYLLGTPRTLESAPEAQPAPTMVPTAAVPTTEITPSVTPLSIENVIKQFIESYGNNRYRIESLGNWPTAATGTGGIAAFDYNNTVAFSNRGSVEYIDYKTRGERVSFDKTQNTFTAVYPALKEYQTISPRDDLYNALIASYKLTTIEPVESDDLQRAIDFSFLPNFLYYKLLRQDIDYKRQGGNNISFNVLSNLTASGSTTVPVSVVVNFNEESMPAKADFSSEGLSPWTLTFKYQQVEENSQRFTIPANFVARQPREQETSI